MPNATDNSHAGSKRRARQRVLRGGCDTAAPPKTLSALTLNIGAASQVRAAVIRSWLAGRSEDVIVLTETSSGIGTHTLVKALGARGFSVCGRVDVRDRGVVLATRLPIVGSLEHELANVTLPWRVAGVVLDTSPRLAIVGVYVPSRDRTDAKIARKRAFIQSLMESVRRLPRRLREHLLLVGDYNVIARRHVPRLPGFFPYEYEMHDALEELGLSPAHELRPSSAQPHSWFGRTGNGYLYDYAHIGASLHDAVDRCSYLHGPRMRRLTDHSALTVRLRLP